jgi:ATP-binding cassette subfamily B protein
MRPTTESSEAKLEFKKQLQVTRRLLPYLWPRNRRDLRIRVGIALALMIAAKVANVYVPIVLKHATDALASDAENLLVAVPIGLLLAYGGVRLASRAFGEVRDAVFARVAQHAIRRVGLQVFRHLHRLSLRFHLDRRTGGLSRAIERGTKGVEFLLSFVLFNIVPTLIEILIVCGILWAMFDWRFAAVTFFTIAAYVWVTYKMTEWRIRFRREMNDADSGANTRAVDSLLNFETVKYFNNEQHEAERYDRGLRVYEDAASKSKVSLSALNTGQAAVMAAGITALMTMAAFGVAAGSMTVGDFVMVNAYLIQLSIPLNLLGTVYREIKQSLVDMETMFEILDQPPEIVDRRDAKPLQVTEGRIDFEHVHFSYDSRREILHDISFAVPAGTRVAIVGPTGAGKSTISRLLFRFYDVSSGAVKIDGQDVREVTQDSVRKAIGIVPQDTVLFNDTIYYNINYGRPEASAEEVYEAARMARIHDFVESLPDGYSSVVGERGLKLSGGEKQRVAIARAILKRPAIMLFDEATSALDTKTEQEIQASLREVAQGRTTLVVAHRLSTVVDSDEILVLEGGRITERGTHTQLLRLGGAYARMWSRQAADADVEAGPEPQTRKAGE